MSLTDARFVETSEKSEVKASSLVAIELPDEMAEADRLAAATIPSMTLMENAGAAVAATAEQCVLLEGDDEAVDDRAGHPELRGDLRDREAVRRVGQQLEHGEATVEGLTGLGDHVRLLRTRASAQRTDPLCPIEAARRASHSESIPNRLHA